MESSLPLLFAAVVGFSHAFEADHLVAVGNIVTKRERPILAVKDGIFWGLGHTSTIFLIGLIMIIGKATFLNDWFQYFEAGVGLMLIVLGVFRLYQFYRHEHRAIDPNDKHHLAYGVGLIHGLAGSGALVLLVMADIQGSLNSIIYLLIFGLGSIIGMLLAAGIFSLPFSKKFTSNRSLQLVLVWLSSLLCIGYGAFVLYENLLG
ncbi:MAG: urease accessory protein [Saprospiraceae bacterium]|nr:urease accessory protein [Saprospiraceae bacterium]